MVKVLVGRNSKYLVEKGKKINTSEGIIEVNKSRGVIRSHIGEKFVVTDPSFVDFVKKFKRGAQVILLKDLGVIAAYVGLRPNWKVLDIGTGSGFSALFFGNLVPMGKVYTYEKDERFYRIAKENLKIIGLKNVFMRKGGVEKIREKNFDLAVIDFKDSYKELKKIYQRVKLGGWIVVYSPTVDELIKIQKAMKKMSFVEVRVFEVFVREWKFEKTLRPKTKGIVHTGFISVGRKFC